MTLNIAIAQSIILTILGYDDTDGSDHDSNEENNKYCDEAAFDKFLNEIISVVADPNPASRHSTGIWLLALAKNCSKKPSISKRIDVLQNAFTELLSDDSEFVQDVASRGLGLLWEMSKDQSNLADSLLNQLLGGKRQVLQVADDKNTKIFEEGQMGKTPTGLVEYCIKSFLFCVRLNQFLLSCRGNITTYKELCSLASDLNKPGIFKLKIAFISLKEINVLLSCVWFWCTEMIYQFMQLANSNAQWNSKLGAAFGLKSISNIAKDQMKPHLEKIVPRLFRYRYDPTPKIQNSMISVWDSIVSDSKETIELYYWAIFEELGNLV